MVVHANPRDYRVQQILLNRFWFNLPIENHIIGQYYSYI